MVKTPFYLFLVLRKHFKIFYTYVFVNSLFSKVQGIPTMSVLLMLKVFEINRKFLELHWNNQWISQLVNISQAMMYYYQLVFYLKYFFWNIFGNFIMLDSCLHHYLLSSDSKAMALHKVSSLHTSFFKIFNKKKLNLWTLDVSGTASYEITLVCLSMHH